MNLHYVLPTASSLCQGFSRAERSSPAANPAPSPGARLRQNLNLQRSKECIYSFVLTSTKIPLTKSQHKTVSCLEGAVGRVYQSPHGTRAGSTPLPYRLSGQVCGPGNTLPLRKYATHKRDPEPPRQHGTTKSLTTIGCSRTAHTNVI